LSKKRQERDNEAKDESGHTLPHVPDKRVLSSYTLSSPISKRMITEYVEARTQGEEVLHAEKVKSERLLERDMDCWDVHTDKDRYWVITSPTNLYSQTYFPSLDYTLSFHVGLIVRVEARQRGAPSESQRSRLTSVWRRWEDALATYDQAQEAEDFQAVGMKCRECLIQLVRTISETEVGESRAADLPKKSDVIHWSQIMADSLAPGSRNSEIRSYLKATARSAWNLANWLTHVANASRVEASLSLDATQTALSAFGVVLVRHESKSPDRCPQCGSYAVEAIYAPEPRTHSYVTICEKCGWRSGTSRGLLEPDSL
jgi:predicted RNA-binding Zn-ribbon protein involved in translation (DUF1610 family)